MKTIVAWYRDETGATSVEYAVIAGIIALSLVIGLASIRDGLNEKFNNVQTKLK
jgi:pilus assembly protein Flp/PilA